MRRVSAPSIPDFPLVPGPPPELVFSGKTLSTQASSKYLFVNNSAEVFPLTFCVQGIQKNNLKDINNFFIKIFVICYLKTFCIIDLVKVEVPFLLKISKFLKDFRR